MSVELAYFRFCDQHNRALMEGDYQGAQRYSDRSEGFLEAYEAMGGNVGSLLIAADLYVMSKFESDPPMCGGRLIGTKAEISKLRLATSQTVKQSNQQINERIDT